MGKLLALFALLGLAGCSMAQSTLIEGRSNLGCRTTSGSYALSKSFLSVELGQQLDTATNATIYYLKSVGVARRADKGKRFCLDYLASPTSNEAFSVERNKSGLLTKIVANSKDQSATIAKDIAKTIFTLVSQNPAFDERLQAAGRAGGAEEIELPSPFKTDFDPFNPAQLAIVNDSLRKFGFCMLIEEQKTGYGQRDVQTYCDRPLGGVTLEAAMGDAHKVDANPPTVREGRAIYYRPRVPYIVYLFVKDNLRVNRGWRLRASEAVHMENLSPVLGVGIERAFFTDRKTTLEFDEGALRDISIDKKSELVGFVEIPLFIAQGIAALPANIIQVRINNTNNNALLINAHQQLIVSEREYRNTLKELRELQAVGTKTGNAGTEKRSGKPDQEEDANPPKQASADTTLAVNECLTANMSVWGEAESRRFCGCVISECRVLGLGNTSSCTNYCSRVRAN